MKTTIKMLMISIILIIPTSIAFTNLPQPQQSSPNITTTFTTQDLDTPKFYLLPPNTIFTSITITNHEYQKVSSPKPEINFYTTNDINSSQPPTPNNISNIIYSSPYQQTLLKKGNIDIIRLQVPSTYYTNSYKYTTTSITLTINYQETQKSLVPTEVPSNIYTKIENKGLLTNPNFKPLSNGSEYDPQSPDYEYLIITHSDLWQTFNDNFKDWKIANDDKINNILIVNVSDITTWGNYTVNDTYGDATNNSNGNHWIPDDKEVNVNWSYFNDTQAQLRNYLRHCYDNYGTRYVLLGGNRTRVPPRMIRTYAYAGPASGWKNVDSHASDMYFACLHYSMNNNTNTYFMENEAHGGGTSYNFDEIDWGFDLCVGRAVVYTTTELNDWINKTKNYVNGNSQGNYLACQMCAAEDGGYSITNSTWVARPDLGSEYIYGIGNEFASNQTFVNNQNITRAQWDIMEDYANGDISGYDGINMLFTSGHGTNPCSATFWDNYKPSLLTNEETPGFVYIESCLVGRFGTYDTSCIEQWMKSNVSLYGGIVNSAYGWFGVSTWYVYALVREMFNSTLGNYTNCFCLAHNDGREYIGHTECTPVQGVAAMTYKETNFFGDPALGYIWYDQTSDTAPQFIHIDNGVNMTTVTNSTPTFNWSIVSESSQYWLQISNNDTFLSLVVNLSNITEFNFPSHYSQNATNVSFTLPDEYALPDYKTYYCRVRGYNK